MLVGSLLSEAYLGSTLPQYALFFAILGAGAVLGRSLRYLYERRLTERVEATATEVDDVILYALGRPVTLLGVVLALFLGRRVLTPVEPLASVLRASVEIPVIVALSWVAIRLTDGLVETYVAKYADRTASKLDDELVPIISRITNIAIVSIAGVVILDSVGYDVTALVASLGIGGVALAFASRKTMADVFGGAHILAAKPFLVEDTVDIDGTTGTVEEIGLRSTQLRDFDGRLVTVPNSTIAAAEVTNVSTEPTRRVRTHVGLSYDTTAAEMDRVLDLLPGVIDGVDGVDPDGTGVWFWEYGDAAMRLRIQYHVAATDRWKAVKDTVNREIQRTLEAEGVEMGFPSRTVRLEGTGGREELPPE